MGAKIFIPNMGANIEIVNLGKLHVKKGDVVKKGDILFEMETDKANFNIEAECSGMILALECKEGEEFAVLDEIGYIGDKGDEIPALKRKKSQPAPETQATPAARRLAKEQHIDLSGFPRGKIITEKDIRERLEHERKEDPQDVRIEKIDPSKKAEIKSISQSKEYITSSITVAVSVGRLDQARERHKDSRTTLGMIVSHAAAGLLLRYPKLNACFKDDSIQYYTTINLGYAISLDDRLLVIVIGSADRLSLDGFSQKLQSAIFNAVKGTVEATRGTFTVTDLSSYGVLSFSPVINAEQAAILGIGAPYVGLSDEGKPERMMNLVLAFDHRVADGSYVAHFLKELKDLLEAKDLKTGP